MTVSTSLKGVLDVFGEEKEKKDPNSMKSTRVADPQISTDVPSWLIDIIKSFKRSQLKQTVKINMLEKRLVGSKEEVQQLKNRIGTLKHESQPVELDDHVSIKSQSNFDASVYIVGGFKIVWSAKTGGFMHKV